MPETIDFNAIKAKICGVKRAGYALVTANTPESLTHGNVKFLSRVRKVALNPVYAENSVESNDSVEVEGNEIVGYTVALDATGMDQETEAEIYGHQVGDNGIMLEEEGDEPPKLALLLELTMSGKNSKFVALYVGSAKHPNEEAESKTRSGVTYGFPAIEFSFTRAMNGWLKSSTRTDATNYSAEIGENWFKAVTYPTAEVNPNAEG